MNRPTTVVIPTAGKGTRLYPASAVVPKALHPIVNVPMIDFSIREALSSGYDRFVIVVDTTHKVEDYLEWRWPELWFVFVKQRSPSGLGHAIWTARDAVNEQPFAVMLPDEIALGQPLSHVSWAYMNLETSVVSISEVDPLDVHRYGIAAPKLPEANVIDGFAIDGFGVFPVGNLIEKPKVEEAPSNFALTGRYILDYEVMNILGESRESSVGEIQLTDALNVLAKGKGLYAQWNRNRRFDCGTPEGIAEAAAEGVWRD